MSFQIRTCVPTLALATPKKLRVKSHTTISKTTSPKRDSMNIGEQSLRVKKKEMFHTFPWYGSIKTLVKDIIVSKNATMIG